MSEYAPRQSTPLPLNDVDIVCIPGSPLVASPKLYAPSTICHRLPFDMFVEIFQNLPAPQIQMLSLVSKVFRAVIKNSVVLQKIVRACGLYLLGGYDGTAEVAKVARLPTSLCGYPLEKTCCGVSLPDMPIPSSHHCVIVVDRIVYVIGGRNGEQRLSRCCAFNPLTNEWESKAAMNVCRSAPAAGHVGKKIYIFGGFDGDHECNSIEVYDVLKNTWTLLNVKSPSSRSQTGYCSLGKNVYIVGGRDGATFSSVLDVFDTETEEFHRLPDLPIPLLSPGGSMMNRFLVVTGGVTQTHVGNEVRESYNRDTFAFDLETNQWLREQLPSIGLRRVNHNSVEVGEQIILNCGFGGRYGMVPPLQAWRPVRAPPGSETVLLPRPWRTQEIAIPVSDAAKCFYFS